MAAAVFATSEIEASAYLAAFVMGLVAGNSDVFGIPRDEQHFASFEHFVVQVSDIAVVGVFVLLGINLDLGRLWDDLLPGLVVMAAFLLVIRPLVVVICLGADRPGRWTRRRSSSSRGAARPASCRRRSPACSSPTASRAASSPSRWSRSRC